MSTIPRSDYSMRLFRLARKDEQLGLARHALHRIAEDSDDQTAADYARSTLELIESMPCTMEENPRVRVSPVRKVVVGDGGAI